MHTLTPADFADTGQWRLIIEIRQDGLEAFLENTLHSEVEKQPLCKANWEKDPGRLKTHIEEVVYANPRLLDDFSTSIVLYTPDVVFMPTWIAEENRNSESEIYEKVYSAEATDVMSMQNGEITAVWSMGPQVKSFLLRSFPGSRITCNLLEKVKYALGRDLSPMLLVDMRNEETDMVLVNNGRLLSATTHSVFDPEKTACLALNIMEIYGVLPGDVVLNISGNLPVSSKWERIKGMVKRIEICEGMK